MADVFISYSHKDGGYAHRLADELKNHQIDVWIDDRIDYGEQWPRVIQDNLAACRVFIVLMSPRSFNSTWVQNEVSYAQAKQKPVFPLLLEGDVWLSMSAMQYVDVQTGEMPPERFFDRLRRELNKPIPPKPPIQDRVSPKPGAPKKRQWMYIGGSVLVCMILAYVLITRPWDGDDTEWTPPPDKPAGEQTEPPVITDTPIIEPPATEETVETEPPTEVSPTATPIYEAGVITFIINTESGQALYILDRDGNQRPLLDEPGMTGLTILSASPPSDDPSVPRYLAVRYSKESTLYFVVLNTQNGSVMPVSTGADGVKANYLEDGKLLVEIQDDNTAYYSLHQMDGSNPAMIYTTVLSLPTSTPTITPEGAQ